MRGDKGRGVVHLHPAGGVGLERAFVLCTAEERIGEVGGREGGDDVSGRNLKEVRKK